MKKVSYFFLSSLMIVLAVCTFSFSSVNAKWFYGASLPVESISTSYKLVDFYWEGSGNLPGDEQDTEYGENHMELLQKVINDLRYGLNAEHSILHNYLEEMGDILYSEQQVSGGNLKHLMIDGTGAYALLFQIEFVSETEYNVYTYKQEDTEDYKIGENIEVYFTKVSKINGKWDGVKTEIGVAKLCETNNKKVPRAVDTSTWVKAK